MVKKLGLEKHPEGGYFKQTYRSDTVVDFEGHDAPQSISSAIYYMLVGDQFSAFHKLKSDEIWHHYAGSSITLYAIES
ncbi:MAG TPA: cupin domain-containing protein [Nitrososphaera sp.]|nr:cupin domain-containing protein [Nitrososphaera sp.]